MRIKLLIFLSLSVFVISFDANGQFANRRTSRLVNTNAIFNQEKLSITAGVGLSSYFGDVCDDFSCMQFRPNFGIGAMLRMFDYGGLKAGFNYVSLYSDDIHEHRNLGFRSQNVEFYAAGYFQLYPFTRHERRKKLINPYGFLGLGLVYFNPQGQVNGEWHNLRQYNTEGESYSPVSLTIPYGGGINIHMSPNWDLMVEVSYRMTFTDYLDDVSSYDWEDEESFSDPIAVNLANRSGRDIEYWQESNQPRGNPSKRDGYFVSQVKIRYTISSNRSHYRLRRSPLRKRY